MAALAEVTAGIRRLELMFDAHKLVVPVFSKKSAPRMSFQDHYYMYA